MVIYVMDTVPQPQSTLQHILHIAKLIFLAFPHCSLTNSLINLNTCLSKEHCDFYGWEEPGIGRNLVYFAGTGVGSFLLILMIEYGILTEQIYKILRLFRRDLPQLETDDQDVDVYNEKQRINAMSDHSRADYDEDNLILKEVSKFYGSFLAVNQISVGVKQ